MRVASINGKKYVLLIVDDYSRYTWTHFLRSKDETPKVLIDFLRLVQRGLHAQVRIVRTDKGTKFLNKTLHAYFASEGILHQASVARTPEQNGVVERQNRTVVEAARTILSAAKVPLFFWAEEITTTRFTQNRSLLIPRHEKTPYHIINYRKPSVKFFHIFGSLCYIVRDGENLDKIKEKGTEFLNQTLHTYFAAEGILHQTLVAQTPEQNGVVKRRNQTLVEAARIMLSATKVPLFFWAKAIATSYFTQNRSLVIPRHEKTPYHIINDQKLSVKFFHIFGSLCYIVRDGENLDKIKEKDDACIFVGYSTLSRAYRVFNKRTRVIVESIHVNFDELPQMASDHVSSDPAPECQRMALEHDSLSPGIQCQENVPQADRTVTTSNELDLLFINEQKLSVKFFHIFGSVCYIVQDGENLDKMKEKGDECIFVGYSTQSRAYRVFNKRTRVIMESIHVNFDELPHQALVQNSSDPALTRQEKVSVHNSADPGPSRQTMASVQISSDPAPKCQTMALEHISLSPGHGNPARADIKQALGRSYALSWKPCQGDSLNLPDHRYKVDVTASFQRSRICKPHAHIQALKVNHSTTRLLFL
nr:retrovirus-related Pol polyprotein from transposon TNT 1-94 [Tanacetum cinerariifolium]